MGGEGEGSGGKGGGKWEMGTPCPPLLILTAFSRYIVAKEPIRSNLLFLSPIRSRKGVYSLKNNLNET